MGFPEETKRGSISTGFPEKILLLTVWTTEVCLAYSIDNSNASSRYTREDLPNTDLEALAFVLIECMDESLETVVELPLREGADVNTRKGERKLGGVSLFQQ